MLGQGWVRFTETRWPTIIALVVLIGATVVGWYWIWGLFFLYWAGWAVVTGQAFVVQMIRRAENPVLFWIICVTWFVLSLLSIYTDLIMPYVLDMEPWVG